MTTELFTALNTAAQIIAFEIRAQAPSQKIANSISVQPVLSSDMETEIEVNFEVNYGDKTYGLYLDFGTMAEREEERGEWNPFPGKGKGGIKPRFFTTPSEATTLRVMELIEEAYLKQESDRIEKQLAQ
jgi:hypothetical protein